MPAPVEIQQLVEKFQREEHRFTAPDYNETQVRREFIDPFFAALGWNVQDSLMVVHEDRVAVKTDDGRNQLKYPDYGFRIGKDTRFYVEAKAPAVRLASDARPAYQVRRYGWSANLPLSILTDFEEFIIYNCTIKPEKDDAAHIARIGEPIRYTDYVAKWDELYALFSREAVLAGSLEEYVRGKDLKGTLRVDEAFLRTLETWRELLAKDIALHNPHLSRRDLNIAVQRTIDRIVFLRICEDRNIEPYGRLLGYKQRREIYEELKLLFRQANDKYNSGLFHFTQTDDETGDAVSLKIHLDDMPLQTVIGGLYYPDSPYVFAVLPADILGQVYERFLGKVIELKPGGAVAVTEKPEVRKAGGVYYTPTYIVEYIVRQTVGVLVANKTPDEVAKLRILDPACGSGSFLIGAYQYLLDWHLDYYAKNRPKTALKDGQLRENADGSYALTTDEKKRILLNNLYGVDLDQQAVEVTKLSLLLKMLEGETSASAQPKLLSDRILPDLASNIKWGNSLIAPDFYEGKQLAMFDDEEFYRVKAFDWRDPVNGFGTIMQSGGFDAVIGNPPYVGLDKVENETRDFLRKRYRYGSSDLYTFFIEKGFSLLRIDGRMGYIVPNKWMRAAYGKALRGFLRDKIEKIIDFGELPVFSQAATFPSIIIIQRDNPSPLAPAIQENNPLPLTPSPLHGEGESTVGKPLYAATYTDTKLWEKLKPLARQMRHEPTLAENHLWQLIRNRQIANAKFRRQHPIDRFIVDFYCAEAHLVIEVDGEIHQYTPDEDALRQAFIESRGLRVLRFTNDQVLNQTTYVLDIIRKTLQTPFMPMAETATNTIRTPKSSLHSAEGGLATAASTPPLHSAEGGLATAASTPPLHSAERGLATAASTPPLHAMERGQGGEEPMPKEQGGEDLLQKESTNQNIQVALVKTLRFADLTQYLESRWYPVSRMALPDSGWTLAANHQQLLLDKLKQQGQPLSQYITGKIYRGIITGLNEAFVIDAAKRQELIAKDARSAELIKPFVLGDDVRKHQIHHRNKYIILIPSGWTRAQMLISQPVLTPKSPLHSAEGGLATAASTPPLHAMERGQGGEDKETHAWAWFSQQYPAVAEYLSSFVEKARKRWDKGEFWWELRSCDYYDKFEKPKIVYPDIAKESRVALDTEGMYFGNTVYFIPSADLYLLGILNSKLIWHYFKYHAAVLGDADKGGRLRWFTQDVEQLPIRTINFDNPTEKAQHDKMVTLVEKMLAYHKELPHASGQHKKTLEQLIASTDREIDTLVYALYGLTEEEIKIVEGR